MKRRIWNVGYQKSILSMLNAHRNTVHEQQNHYSRLYVKETRADQEWGVENKLLSTFMCRYLANGTRHEQSYY